jgi:hypothetical protein
MKATLSAVLLIALGAVVLTVSVVRRSAGDTVAPLPAIQSPAIQSPAIELPTRTASAAAVVTDVPAVPAGARTLPPLAFMLTTVWEGPGRPRRKTTQTVTRTSDRIRVVPDGGGPDSVGPNGVSPNRVNKEWIFERNAVHETRVFGYLIDHASRQILVHDDSDLRNGQQVRGWADVLMMRFDPRVLGSLRATGETETAGGAVFARYVAADRGSAGVVDVWWSEAVLLPLRLTVREGGVLVSSTITRLARTTDLAALRDPRLRLPGYEVVEASDARERRH